MTLPFHRLAMSHVQELGGDLTVVTHVIDQRDGTYRTIDHDTDRECRWCLAVVHGTPEEGSDD